MCRKQTMGYVKIFRKITEWGWHDDPNTFALWIHLLLGANWKDNLEWHGEKIPRGTLITSTPKLMADVGLTERQVRTSLDKLVKTGEIVRQTTNKWSKITICKYALYQDMEQDECQTNVRQAPDKRQTSDGQTSAIEESKKVIKKESKKSADEPLHFPYTSEKFMRGWEMLTQQPKWKGKTKHALQLNLNDLGKYEEEFAWVLMGDAIKNNWQGIVFEDTPERYERWKERRAREEAEAKKREEENKPKPQKIIYYSQLREHYKYGYMTEEEWQRELKEYIRVNEAEGFTVINDEK